ncbi:vesicle transport protein SFT2A isoform X2 [Amborella trichopoda]|uniref:vesicle transport protein SFT2A isoform X2 n=1 Tax=Amborella trichopoda TaxID=13333 RepID=UPI0009BCB572|nr:vesicle transport protein SFT2A isoform X2 [Amborella trichopoda]XP_020527872.1 vesicle transport protein SFT2A isoform X2 [Amborella trichopoda]|eukprot:XP_020527871.1 vesicle transport protein SFT2A isoform X2 [Amborella trichopoda]
MRWKLEMMKNLKKPIPHHLIPKWDPVILEETFNSQSLVVFFRPIKFAIAFSFGNILAIGRVGAQIPTDLPLFAWGLGGIIAEPHVEDFFTKGTAFLIGPIQQARMMLDPVRVYATCIYIGSVILALVCALWVHNKILTLLAIISEICALIWASASLTKPILEQLCDNGTNQQKALILQRSMHQLRYSLSYIPFARRMVSDLIISCCDTEF